MPELFELRLEVPFVAPDNAAIVSSRLKEAIGRAAVDSGVEKVVVEGTLEPTFGQSLPTREEVGFVLAVLSFAIQVGPIAWPHLKAFWENLQTRLQKTSPGQRVTAHFRIDDKEVRVENFTKEDAIVVLTKEYEARFKPRPRR